MDLVKLNISVPLNRTLKLSSDEAKRLHHEEVDTADIVAGMLLEGEGTGAIALAQIGVDIDSYRRIAGRIFGEGKSPPNPQITYSQKAEKVLVTGREVADCLNHQIMGTGHVLFVISRDEKSNAAGVLKHLGFNLDDLRTITLTILNQDSGR